MIDLNTPVPEVGLRIKQSARGKGYGKEMVDTLIKWLENHRTFEYISYKVHIDNIGSRKIAERFGAVLQLDDTGKEKVFTDQKFDRSSSLPTVEYRIYKK